MTCPTTKSMAKIVSPMKKNTNSSKDMAVVVDNNDLSVQIEDQFFTGHSPSLKKTVDFLSDRIASKCIRRVKTEVFVKCKQCYIESTDPLTVDDLDFTVITNCIHQQCNSFVDDYCAQQITKILPLLLNEDIDPTVYEFATSITTKYAEKTCVDWIQTNITTTLVESNLKNGLKKKLNKSSNVTPDVEEPQDVSTVVDICPVFNTVRDLMADLYKCPELVQIETINICDLVSDLSQLRRKSRELPKRTLDFIDVNVKDFLMALIANKPDLLVDSVVQRFVDYWREFSIIVDKFICPRNLVILSERSISSYKSWNKYESILLTLLGNNITTPKIVEGDVLWTVKQEWSESVLKRLASCLRLVADQHIMKRRSSHNDPTIEYSDEESESNEIIDWLSWFCGQSDDQF
ncbi:uncharacterized protein LOC128955723 [Oppia nitens]|uniref:uncharacterized protein LOC128955723 n=1 Tax=Oppia nitens TaxID=1686743 RepID=UPI0023DAFF38|nr:uncharacterized protein LOC128955723 [Oppia nitens]